MHGMLPKDCVAAMELRFWCVASAAHFFDEVINMGLFTHNEVKITTNHNREEMIYSKAFPIIKLFKELTSKHLEHYLHLETFPVDMIDSILKYLVDYRGLDGRIAKQFNEKYIDPALNGANLERTLFYMGEEQFDEMVDELFKLAAPYIK